MNVNSPVVLILALNLLAASSLRFCIIEESFLIVSTAMVMS